MKKITLLVLMVVFYASAAATTIEKTYYFENPTMQQNRNFSEIVFKGTLQSALSGQPSLPWQPVSLLLPYGEKAVSIEIVASDICEIEGVFELFPYQPSQPLSETDKPVFQYDKALYESNMTYPQQNVGHLTSSYMNGCAFAFASFTPVTYNPATRKVSYAQKVVVRIETAQQTEDKTNLLWLTPEVENRAKRLAQNPEQIDSYKAHARTVSNYDLLIITPENFVSNFDAYVEFYNSEGIRTEIVSKETILAAMQGVDVQEQIRNYIIEQYQENGISMVVLGGDVSLIPYRGLFCQVQSSTLYEDNGIPADLYYSALDGTWNDNNNNKWGEIGEDDLLPEVGVSRMPFETAAELQNLIHKTLSYQQTPVLGEFRKVLLAGEFMYNNPESWGKDYLDLLIGECTENGYTTIGIPEDYEIETLYEFDNSWSGSTLMGKINQGVQFVHHVGHASPEYVAHLNNYQITNSNFAGANGVDHNYTFFHTHGCDCGSFDYNDCILEKMVLIENFAVAVMGNSRYGWFNEGQTEGPACHLHREMTDALYHEKIPFLSLAMVEAKAMTAPWVTAPGQWEEGALRWNFYDLNILGDGTAKPWLDEPFEPEITYESQLIDGTESTVVFVKNNGIPVEKARCSIVFGEETIAFGITDATGEVQLQFDQPVSYAGEAKLLVNAQNMFTQQRTITLLSTNNLLADNSFLLLYPNPTEDIVSISFENVDKKCCNVKIFDLSGRLLLSQQTTENQRVVDVSRLGSGMYLVVLDNGEQQLMNKLIKR